MPIPVFMLNILAGSVLFGWLFVRTGGSILPAVILHMSLNTWAGILIIVPTATTGQPFAIVTGLLVLVAISLLLAPGRMIAKTVAQCCSTIAGPAVAQRHHLVVDGRAHNAGGRGPSNLLARGGRHRPGRAGRAAENRASPAAQAADMLTLYLLQAIVPLALIAWLALAPPRSTVGFWVQAITAGLALVAIGMVGIWSFPPW